MERGVGAERFLSLEDMLVWLACVEVDAATKNRLLLETSLSIEDLDLSLLIGYLILVSTLVLLGELVRLRALLFFIAG